MEVGAVDGVAATKSAYDVRETVPLSNSKSAWILRGFEGAASDV